MSWYGPRLASHGFVVFTIDVNNTFLDFPDARGTQILAALDYLVGANSGVADRIDRTRLAAMGHSMGGGGTLAAANTRKSLKAVIPLTPWHTTAFWSGVTTPTMIIGGQADVIAPVASHAEPFYASLPATSEKAYAEMANGNHFVVTSPNPTVSRLVISWLKRFVDNDTRHDQFLCPPPTGTTLAEYRDSCPLGTPGGGNPSPDPEPPTCEWWDFWCWLGLG